MKVARNHMAAITLALTCSFAWQTPANAIERAQDETLAYSIGVQTYIYGFPMMDLYRTLWETSFDPGRFDPQPPVNAFWSLTMYSAETQLFVLNAINRYSVGDRTKGTVYGKDGSLEIFLQADEPTDPRERANWLPAPKGRFYLLIRHYSPKAAILTGDWLPPPITRR